MKTIHKEFAVAILLHMYFSFLPMNCLGLSTKHIKPIKPGQGVAHAPLAKNVLNFADERLAVVYPIIQKFKNSITSDPHGITKTWVGSDICKYKGFFCDNPPYNTSAIAVASIDFNGFQLSAPTLHGFLDQFPDLALFHANSNRFSGTISPNITELPYLYEFDISNNQFSGSFPLSILNMPSLSFLDIRFNSFSGSVPDQLFTEDINALFINNNDFIMKLPEIVASNSILLLTLANNKFFGPIPDAIFESMSSLKEVLFLNNLLSGCLPNEVGLLKEAVVFDVGNNELTGQLPFSLGCLENLEVLNLAGNMFFGMVPEVVCLLGKLGNFSLTDNYITGVGPICLGLINNGILDVRNNCIPGLPFQRPMVECIAFISRPRFCQRSQMPMFPNIPCWLPKFQSKGLAPSPS